MLVKPFPHLADCCLSVCCLQARTNYKQRKQCENMEILKDGRSSAISPLLSTPYHFPLKITIHFPTMSAPRTTITAPTANRALLRHDLDWVVTRIDQYGREEIEAKTAAIYYPTNDEHNKDIYRHNLKAAEQKLETCKNL